MRMNKLMIAKMSINAKNKINTMKKELMIAKSKHQ